MPSVQSLKLILLFAVTAFAADYYIEPAPTAPRLCTLARPCTYGLLPALTSADTVHFLPATTGTSNTYSLGTKTLVAASMSIDSPLIVFSNTNLRNKDSASLYVNSVRFNAGSLGSQGVTSVTVQNSNFTSGSYLVLDGQTITLSDSKFFSLSGSNRHIIYGTTISVLNLQFSDSKSSGHLISFQPSVTFTADSYVEIEGLSFSNCNTTTSSGSIVAVQSSSGKNINAGALSSFSFVNCNSKSALYLAKCNFQSSSTPFAITSTVFGLSVTGGSVFKGVIALESNAATGGITHTTEELTATGVDFNSGAIYTLVNSGTQVTQNTMMSGGNSVCESSNLNYIASCTALSGAPVYEDYALIKGVYANVTIGPFDACTNTTLDVVDVCGLE